MILCAVGAALPATAAPLPPEVARLLPQTAAGDSGGWRFDAVLEALWRLLGQNGTGPLHFGGELLLYLLLACLVSLLCTQEAWQKCLEAVTVLGFGALSLSAMQRLTALVAQTAQQCQSYLVTFIPVYSGVLALGGQAAGAAGYGGLFLAMSAFLAMAIEKVLLPVLRIYFCFAVSAVLWGNPGVEQAADLFANCFRWLLKGCGVLFGFVLGLQNMLSGVADTAAVRMGGSVLAGAIPIVGDAAAAALSSAGAAVHLLKGTLALALCAAMGAAFGPVLVQSVLYSLAFSAAGILASGGALPACGRLCRLFADGARLCISILTLYFFMAFLSTALLLVLGNGG